MKRMVQWIGTLLVLVVLVGMLPQAEAAADIRGDLTGDGKVSNDDVLQLLWCTLFPEDYATEKQSDLNGDGRVSTDDVLQLLWFTLFPDDYELLDGFQAGFGMADITPKASVPLASYGDSANRLSVGGYTDLEARCVAIRDGYGQLMLFLVGDVSWAPNALGKRVRNDLSAELGISADYIVISGTHTHASVDTGLTSMSSVVDFNNQYVEGMKTAARAAIADLKPAAVYEGSVTTKGMNFVRRYIMDDGSLVGDNAYGTGTKIVRHETNADPELQMLRFVRDGGKDILITNFQAHPHLESKTKYYSSQTVGAIRDAVEAQLGAHSLHWQGAAGNLNTHSRIGTENIYTSGKFSEVTRYGQDMVTKYIAPAYDSLTPVAAGAVQVRKVTYTGQVNHQYDNQLTQAQMVVDYFKSGHTAAESATYAHKISAQYGLERRINSYYHANRILANAKLSRTKSMDLVAWSFGDVGGVVLPYEMFDTSGMQMKTQSPFARTFIVGYSYPSYTGYIPTEAGYANGGYEADNSTFAPGAAEGMVANYLQMLEDMHK